MQYFYILYFSLIFYSWHLIQLIFFRLYADHCVLTIVFKPFILNVITVICFLRLAILFHAFFLAYVVIHNNGLHYAIFIHVWAVVLSFLPPIALSLFFCWSLFSSSLRLSFAYLTSITYVSVFLFCFWWSSLFTGIVDEGLFTKVWTPYQQLYHWTKSVSFSNC